MGKIKKRRTVSHKNVAPPTGGPSQAEIEDAMEVDEEIGGDVAAKQAPDFLSGLTNLQGSVREATCVALASFFAGEATADKQKMLQKMLNGGLLKKLLPRIVDPSKLVRLHALGALRNISAFGGLDASEYMTKEDSLTPLLKLITEYATDATLSTKDAHAIQILEQVFSLLTNICESSSMALVHVTHARASILPGLLVCLRMKQPALQLETMKFLLVLSDNNPDLSQNLPAEFPPTLLAILQAPEHSTKLRLTTIGVAINLPNVLDNPQSVALLLPVLKSAVAYDSIGVVGQAQAASEQWEMAQQDYGTVEVIAEDDHEELDHQAKVKKALGVVRAWRDNVHILSLALELISNMLANVDTGADEDEWDSDDEDGMEAAAQNQSQQNPRPVSVPAQAFGAENLLAHIYTIVQSVVSIPPNLASAVVDDFTVIRERAVNALTNLFAYLSVADLTKACDLTQAFHVLVTLHANAQATPKELFKAEDAPGGDVDAAVYVMIFYYSMSALSALVLRSVDDKLPLEIPNDHLGVVMAAAHSSPSVEARVNAIRLLGTLGKKPHTLPQNKVLATCLGQVLNDSDLQVVCEVLNALFDIYSDEQYDAVFFELNFLTSLEHLSSGMKSKIKSDAKTLDRELVAHAKETRLNLLRFIKYKKQHRR
ncbi:Aste57867_44 [Aphanomyces stellatus]|uniref:Aste57867_44 protein n=1 Tax=Aphanomyces stellatus TaxID=120398 RepID=A0A485K1S8_9STRA|nr:hypothetical protein As57867_000044 [Aphanomyces stellatus]VFT77270.1 Aste57867_44 [Aphanomyces stellatus]